MIATAPGKLILSGEYAVLDGAPALVVAVDRRVTASFVSSGSAMGSSPFLLALMAELSQRGYAEAARAVPNIRVDSSAFYDNGQKLGLGSSAAVTVAATKLALACYEPERADVLRGEVFQIACVAHRAAQGGAGSNADIAAATFGGTLVVRPFKDRARNPGEEMPIVPMSTSALNWPTSIRLLPFFTGRSADTVSLVARVAAARAQRPTDVDAALAAIASASTAIAAAIHSTIPGAPQLIAAFKLAGLGVSRLAIASGVDLVPDCVSRAASALAAIGGTAKTTGAGGGDIGVAVIPSTADVSECTRILIECGCQPLRLSVDETGVDTRPGAQ